jgi:protein O-mannosyl-transferase
MREAAGKAKSAAFRGNGLWGGRALGLYGLVKHIPTARRMPSWAWGALVVMLALIVFLPALRFPFFPFWDDDIHVHANPHIAQLSWASLGALWTGPWQQLYIPLTYSVWAGLAALSRWWDGWPLASGPLNAAWFHGANVLLHATSAALAFALIKKITTRFRPEASADRLGLAAALGAALFVLHPLQVEPVAWISGLRDVLGGSLGLGALLVLFSGERLGPARWSGATVLFLASLAAKPAGVALPLMAGILALQPFRWPGRKSLAVLLPWLLFGGVWVLVTSRAQWAADLASGLVPLWARPLVAADALAFYAEKTLWPAGLAADYGRAPNMVMASGQLWWTWLIPLGLAAALTAVKRLRIFLVPAGLFAVALLPTLGLVPFNFQVVSTVADRYAYLALLGPALGLALVVAGSGRRWTWALAAAAVALLAAVSAQRLPLWSEDLKLFASTLETNPRSWKAMHNYASALDDRGRSAEAEPLLREVIALRPDSAEAHNDLGVILWNLGKQEEAVLMVQRALQLRPTTPTAQNLVQMQALRGNLAGVVEALRLVIQLDPNNALARQQLDQVLQQAAGQL